jgi:hypothetical protein
MRAPGTSRRMRANRNEAERDIAQRWHSEAAGRLRADEAIEIA